RGIDIEDSHFQRFRSQPADRQPSHKNSRQPSGTTQARGYLFHPDNIRPPCRSATLECAKTIQSPATFPPPPLQYLSYQNPPALSKPTCHPQFLPSAPQ